MYKLIIVEDERREREGLVEFLDWKSMGIEIAGTACDGIEGVELAREVHPDIIITDIRMPVVDGLAMTRQIKAFLPQVKVVILTGYDDFKYAKEAIDLNTSGYLLKPVQRNEAVDLLSKVIAECDSLVNREHQEVQIRNELQESQEVVKTKLFMDLLWEKATLEEVGSKLGKLGICHVGEPFMVLIINTLPSDDSTELQKNGLISRQTAICADTRSIFENRVLLVNPDVDLFSIIVLIQLRQDEDIQLNFQMCSIQSTINQKYGVDTIIGASEVELGLEGILKAYNQARECVEHGFFLNPGEIIFYSDISQATDANEVCIQDFLINTSYLNKQIVHGIRTRDSIRVMNLLDELFCYLFIFKGIQRSHINSFFTGLLNETALTLYSMSENLEAMAGKYDLILEQLLDKGNIKSLRQWVTHLFIMITDKIDEKHTNREDDIVLKLIRIIENRYMDDICIKTIAADVYLSPNYLGSLFKKVTDKSFNAYLTSYRMEKARDLLKAKSSKVSRIAEAVGMPNTSYFAVVFKNTFGVTPKEYQENLRD